MNKLLTKIVGAALGVAMTVGVGVAVASNQKVEAAHAGDVVYKTVEFIKGNCDTPTSTYTDTATYTDDITVDCINFNCNKTSGAAGWDFIKCGRKNNASTGSIVTTSSIDKSITRVAVTIDSILDTSKVNSIKLYSSSNGSSWTEESSFSVATGKQAATISSPAASKYYKVEFDCASHTANGIITVSKIEYYQNGSAPSLSVTPDSAIINKNSYEDFTATATDGTGSVSWVSEDSDIASVSSATGTSVRVTGEARGETNITVSYSTAEDVVIPIIVTDIQNDGTQAHPYTTEEAIDRIKTNTGLTGVYVTGIVSHIVTEYSEQYHNISFDMSSDGLTTSEQFRAYRATGTEAANIAVGNIVVVSGDLTKHNTTYELAEGCSIQSRVVPTYTVSFNGNGGSGSMANVTDVSGVYTLPNNGFTAPNGKLFSGWKANNDGALIAAGATYTVTSNVTFYAQWANKITVTYHANGGSGADVEAYVPQGSSYTVAANTFTAPDGMSFNKWNTVAAGTGTAYSAGAVINPLNADLDLFAQWKLTPQEKKDTITLASFDAITSYSSHTCNGSVSNTAYTVFLNANGTDMQFKSKDSVSGLVNTSSKGTVKSVKITVASGDNTIDIYGSNTAYTDPSNLYGDGKGTKVGSLTTTGTVTFDTDYDYFGIRSNNGVVYISEIEITWLIVPKAVDHIGASSVTEPGPFYVGTKPTLSELGVTVTAYYNAGETDSEVVTGLATITYPSTGLTSGAANYTISYGGKTTTVSITGTVGNVYTKLTLTSELINGSTIRIATNEYVMTPTTSSSQLTGLEGDATNASLSGVANFTVGSDSEGYYFYETTEEKYLAVSGDSTNLSLSATLNTKAHWSVSISSFGIATITSSAYATRLIQMNSSTHRFGAFTGGQTVISIFLLVDNDMTEEQKTAAQVETFSDLFMHKLDIAHNPLDGDSGNCYGTDGTDGYFAKAKAALDGDWAPIASAFSQCGNMWDRYVAWGARCGVTVSYNNGIQYNAQSINLVYSTNETNAAAIIAIVSVISLSAVAGFFLLRKRKEQ